MKTMKVSQKGQTIVLFALGLLALLAMAALLVDGGQSYMHRRQAQAAADAGALAGARELCAGNFASAIDKAEEYVIQNGAIPSPEPWFITPDPAYPDKKELVVEAHIAQKSFFAQLIGLDEVDVIAQAASGCYPPGAMKGVLPVAWSCHPPSLVTSESEDCQYQTVEWSVIENKLTTYGTDTNYWFSQPGNYLDNLYIIMDSDKLASDVFCQSEGGPVDCDLDDDLIDDLSGGGGNRSWLNLNGGNNPASELSDWLKNGFAGDLAVHYWLPAGPGERGSVYKDAKEYTEKTVIWLPVYNSICPDAYVADMADGTPCEIAAHEDFGDAPDVVKPNNGIKESYFHIVGFAPLFVSCVKDKPGSDCPGYEAVKAENPTFFDKTKDKSIEGYFVRGYEFEPGEGTPGGVDLGYYVRSLTQ